MTGYGSGEGPVSGGRLLIEIRTVNHRHFNVQFKVPYALQELEAQLRELLRGHIARGHLTLAARWTEDPPRETAVRVNVDRAKDYVIALAELRAALQMDGDVDLGFVARQPDVLNVVANDGEAVLWEEVAPIAQDAMQQVVGMREREGAALLAELRARLAAMDDLVAHVERRAPQRLAAERDRLRDAVSELVDGRPVNEDRLAQEIAILADKMDITEEIVRLRAHLEAVDAALDGSGAVGKQLGFLAQEMLRETNTIGSKANDADIAHRVVAMKGELEKFREQIENIE